MTQKQKGGVLGVLLAAVVVVFYLDTRGPSLPNRAFSFERQPYKPLPVENPALQHWKLDASRRTEYKGGGRDLFSEVALASPPVTPTPAPKPGPVPQPDPPPPTLPGNMKFFGYGTVPNGTAKRAFLTDGEEVYIVAEGDTLLGRFRIVRIGNVSLEFEETSTGRRNSAALDEQAAPPA